MTSFVFPPPATPSVPVLGQDARFPVRRILCVGRNSAAHRGERGGDDRDPPFFFAKPADAIVPPGGAVPYPPGTADLHHEIELVVALGGGGADVSVEAALGLVFGYAVGVDLTRRDLQNAARGKGQPWDAAKGFDASAPVSAVRPWTGAPPAGAIRLWVGDARRQNASLSDMIWSVPEIIAEASKLWRLEPGDLIFTGTPDGVGPLIRGDAVRGEIDGVGDLAFTVA
jgi:fumarylpyruvate hydrolase